MPLNMSSSSSFLSSIHQHIYNNTITSPLLFLLSGPPSCGTTSLLMEYALELSHDTNTTKNNNKNKNTISCVHVQIRNDDEYILPCYNIDRPLISLDTNDIDDLERIQMKYISCLKDLYVFLATITSFQEEMKPSNGIIIDDLDVILGKQEKEKKKIYNELKDESDNNDDNENIYNQQLVNFLMFLVDTTHVLQIHCIICIHDLYLEDYVRDYIQLYIPVIAIIEEDLDQDKNDNVVSRWNVRVSYEEQDNEDHDRLHVNYKDIKDRKENDISFQYEIVKQKLQERKINVEELGMMDEEERIIRWTVKKGITKEIHKNRKNSILELDDIKKQIKKETDIFRREETKKRKSEDLKDREKEIEKKQDENKVEEMGHIQDMVRGNE